MLNNSMKHHHFTSLLRNVCANFAQEVEHYGIGAWILNAWLKSNHATSIHGPPIQKASEGAKV